MVPKGLAWQTLRQQALGVVPNGTIVLKTKPATLEKWLSNGSFVTTTTSRREFVLSAAHGEVASALHAEASFHLDHAAEHSVTIRNQLHANRWYSAGWLCVTFYYWAFFVALSITRMLGKTALFLSRDNVRQLHTISRATTTSPGAGAFIFECTPAATLSYADVSLKKSTQTRVHNLIWNLLSEQLAILSRTSHGSGDTEERLYLALTTAFSSLGSAWPSDLRNSVNYSPGCGYAAGREVPTIRAFGSLRVDPPSNFDEALSRLENCVAAIPHQPVVADNLNNMTHLLIEMTFILDCIATDLHKEVVARRHIDVRWQNARSTFFDQQFAAYGVNSWPLG
jgi:hypothetical protein